MTDNSRINVKHFGANGDGVTSDVDAINEAIREAGRTGLPVFIPSGDYVIDKTITINNRVTIQGSGFTPYRDQNKNGTWFCLSKDGNYDRTWGVDVAIRTESLTADGTVIRDLAITQEQEEPSNGEWLPNRPNLFAFFLAGRDLLLENIHLYNVTNGIRLENVGNVTLNQIFGRPLRTGIQISYAADKVKIFNIHFWPYWENSSNNVWDYMLKESVGILTERNDNPHFNDVFMLGYGVGIRMQPSDPDRGRTTFYKIHNAEFDHCRTGIEILGDNQHGQISNLTGGATNPNNLSPTDSSGLLWLTGGGKLVQVSNLFGSHYPRNVIYAEGGSTHLHISNALIIEWDQANEGHAAIKAIEGAGVMITASQMNKYNEPRTRTEGDVRFASFT